MKKIALLLVFVMILGGCFLITSCGKKDNGTTLEKTPADEARDCVKFQMMAEMNWKTLGGATISFVSCTYGTTTDRGNNNFKISGTVKVRDQYGNFHVANYDALVEYDAKNDDYDAEIEYGTFKKQ